MDSDKLRRYKELRTQVVDFITDADAALAENAATRGTPKGTELEQFKSKVENDRFEMVLIGAFQSGKSTFFNYLCDGRELSPIGYGIRTSGCKVSAHYVESDRDEKAVLTWRSPAELLQSLGNTLVPYLARENAKGSTCLTEEEVNLSRAKDRQSLADAAWEALASPQNEDSLELVRLALLVSKFYPDYEQRCKRGATEMSFEEATKMASYPSNWSKLWLEAMQGHDLSCFKPQNVAFAFVSAMDVYVNSPMLKSLGCSVTDSPGLFISEWDSAIARQCMRLADVVLFSFSGEREMGNEEKKVLQACRDVGIQEKIILGVNLKVPESQWQSIMDDSMRAKLIGEGFAEPVVIPYHAALALRSREYMCLLQGGMQEETKKAIDSMIARKDPQAEGTDERRLEFLRKNIDWHLGVLSEGDEGWETYAGLEARDKMLDERSGAPAFINAASSIMAPRKSRSVLIEQGVKPALQMLGMMAAESRDRQAFLNHDIETKRRKLQEQEEIIDEFERNRQAATRNVRSQLELSINKISDHFRRRAEQKFDERNEEIVNRIYDKLPTVLTAVFCDKVRLSQEFMNSIAPVFNDILDELRSEIADTFIKLPAFALMRQTFEDERRRLVKEASALKELGSLQDIKITLDANYGDSAKQMVIGQVKEIFQSLLDDQANIWTFIWSIVTCGLLTLTIDRRAQARKMLDGKRGEFHQMLGNAIVNALHSDRAPFQLLNSKVQEFSDAFEQPAKSFSKLKAEKETDLERAEDNREIIETLGHQVERAEDLRKRGASLRESCEKFCLEGN